MNISSSSSTQMMQTTSMSSKNSNLSSEQKALIDEVLSNFDANSLSADDATAIVEAFSEAGISASGALASTMEAAGFDAKEVGDLANVASTTGTAGTGGGRPAGGPPPPPPSAEDEEEVESIYDLLEALLETDEEDETSSTITTNSMFSGTGYEDEGSSFETVLDYTSKILRLKDDAKTDVMEMLNEFSADETNLENEDLQKTLLTSLSEILNKTDNYNKISFYA